MPTNIVVIGQGGHGRVVADTVHNLGFCIAKVYDDNPRESKTRVYSDHLVEQAPMTLAGDALWHVAIGDNHNRHDIISRYETALDRLITLVHGRAVISKYSSIGSGCFVAANAVVGPDAKLGKGCIINHGAVVDHDCSLADFVHVAPNATLGGGVSVGNCSLVGSGAVVLPGIRVGDNVVVGSGAVVTADVPNGQVVIGVPARLHTCYK